jgi:hypothetical protein
MRVLVPAFVLLAACSGRRLAITVDAGSTVGGEVEAAAPALDASDVTADLAPAEPDLAEDLGPPETDAGNDAGTDDGNGAAGPADLAPALPAGVRVLAQDGDFILAVKQSSGLDGVPVGEVVEIVFELTYTGASANVIGIPITGQVSYEVTGVGFTRGHSSCPSHGGIFARSPCSVSVAFQPRTPTTHQGMLTVTANPGGRVVVALEGTGVLPGVLRISPERFDFPPTPTVGPGSSLKVTVTNLGPQRVGRLQESVPDRSDFRLAPACDERSLAPGESCTSEIVFRPSYPGPKAASYSVRAGLQTLSVLLTGTGI